MSITILIVDDEDNFREGLDQYLTFKKFNVLEAANLTEARKQLRENSIDVVLLDVQIGKEYGPDLLDDIRLVRPTPITILLTAYGEVDMAASRRVEINFVIKTNYTKKAEAAGVNPDAVPSKTARGQYANVGYNLIDPD